MRELLALSDDRGRPCDAVDAIARVHLAEVERKIADLCVMRDELAGVVGSCGKGTVAQCRIIDTLGPNEVDA